MYLNHVLYYRQFVTGFYNIDWPFTGFYNILVGL